VPEQEFYDFDEALNQLNLREEELKRLVSEGEIRAFRAGETMKLRRTDVESLKNELLGVDLVQSEAEGEDLVFEDDLGFDEAGMATEEISDMDTLLEEDVEDVGEVELEEAPVEAELTPDVAPRRAAAVEEVEQEAETVGVRFLAIATTAVLVLALPVVISMATGHTSDVAKAVAGLFGADIQ
jgi:excisionase family DNA binding protein